MFKLEKNFEKVKELYASNNKKFVFDSIIEGNTPGEIYVDHIENPQLYIVYDGGNFVLYVGGEASEYEDYLKCGNYIKNNILTEELKEENDEWILISYTSQLWKEVLNRSLKGLRIEKDQRTLFSCPLEHDEEIKCKFDIQLISESMLEKKSLENIHKVIDEIEDMWGNCHTFIENGFGVCALDGDKIIGWCTGEFFSTSACGIGIYTIEDYRNKGIAEDMARKFVAIAKERELTPHWDAWTLNKPSIKVAEKAGFNEIEEYEVMVVQF